MADNNETTLMLAKLFDKRINDLGITGAGAGRIIGATKAEVSNVRHGRLGRVSVERLLNWLNALGVDLVPSYRDIDLSAAARPVPDRSEAT
ncbi:XRE family transcriptional regulator [Nocardia elegans]|uniref:XRE family transcriptional regulator n=1 Tax=Nocardia elegans TaxID=300029 RepID=UPI001894C8C7|nr:XRE family transcriptional regulator [Nocardia elegans]MBF6449504.1 XRE family transcriptional regulator [Nocardia elegans]